MVDSINSNNNQIGAMGGANDIAPVKSEMKAPDVKTADQLSVHAQSKSIGVITIVASAPELDTPDPASTTPTGLQQVQAQLELAFPILKVIGNIGPTIAEYMKSHPGGLAILGPSVLVALVLAQAKLTQLAKEQRAVFGAQFIEDLKVTINAMEEKIKADIEGGQLQADQFKEMGRAGLNAAIASLTFSVAGFAGSMAGSQAAGKLMEGVAGGASSIGQAQTNFIQSNYANPIAAKKAQSDGYANFAQLAQQMMQKDMQNYDAVGNTLDSAMKGLSDALTQFFQAMQMRL